MDELELKLLLDDLVGDVGAVDQLYEQFLELLRHLEVFDDVVVPLPEDLVLDHLDLILTLSVLLQFLILADVLQEDLLDLLSLGLADHLGQRLRRLLLGLFDADVFV